MCAIFIIICIAKQKLWDICEDSVLLEKGRLFKCEAHPLGSSESRGEKKKKAILVTHSLVFTNLLYESQ